MNHALLAIVIIPAIATIATWWTPVAISKVITICSGIAVFALALALIPSATTHGYLAAGPAFRADALSIVFLVPTTFLYATTSIFAAGYLHLPAGDAGRRYARRFYAGLNIFCWSMAVAPLVNGLALLWVAIEVTTVVSALLVAIDDTDGAIEAAWKYILLASLGLGIALLATIFMYYAGTKVFGSSYDLSYGKLLSGAHGFPKEIVRLADVLAVLGFGTKMGLVPVHTWLPDAHSEAPTPISALLSGALLAMSFYAILRFFQVSVRCLGPTFPRNVLLIFGLASLALAALYLLSQRDLKRLLAYSSVEHMGILAIGMSFAAPLAIVGVLLHVIAHAAAKGTAFFGAGSVVRKFKTKDMARIRGGVGLLPWSGPMLVLAVLALSAMPPFGIFRSEFLIVAGGLSDPHDVLAAVLVVLVTVAFFGLSWFTTQTMLTPVPEREGLGLERGETSRLIVVAMAVGLVGLVVLGVHVPGQLSDLLHDAATQLEAVR
ncbi:MAG TPA: proton-conducting transporter membrane subunit [Acidimicrobiales bacterium]